MQISLNKNSSFLSIYTSFDSIDDSFKDAINSPCEPLIWKRTKSGDSDLAQESLFEPLDDFGPLQLNSSIPSDSLQ